MHIQSPRTLARALSGLGLLTLGLGAEAQSSAPAEESTSLERVVITSQRRVELKKDVPLAVTVTGREQLERQQINTVSDLVRTSPAFEVGDAGSSPGGAGTIRGIGTNSFGNTSEAAVGIVVDGVPQANANISSLFDIDRVEVLRGPQGMLFGQTASAGVINITTGVPRMGKFESRVSMDFSQKGTLGSRYGERTVRGMVNVPVNEDSALRISGMFSGQQGLRHNNRNGQDLETEDYSLRTRYLWSSNGLSIDASVDLNKRRTSGPNFFTVFKQGANPMAQGLLAACGVEPSPNNMNTCGSHPEWSDSYNHGLALTLEKELDNGFVLTSVTGHRVAGESAAQDLTGLAGNIPEIWFSQRDSHQHNTTQEFRVTSPVGGPFDFVAGLFYSQSGRASGQGPGGINLDFPPISPPFPPDVVDNGIAEKSRITSKALFSQANYHVTKQLTLFAGARYTQVDLTTNQAAKTAGVVGAGRSDTTTDHNLSGRLGLKYDVTTDTMVYASGARGYKGPALFFSANGAGPATVLRGEVPTSVEAGVKSNLFGGKATIDVNAFRTTVKDYQGQTCVTGNASSGPAIQCSGVNIDGVVTKGLEIDFAARPVRGLTVNAGFIHNPVTYPRGYIGGDGADLGGKQIAWAPRDKLTLSGEAAWPLAGHEGFASLEANRRSAVRLSSYGADDYLWPAQWTFGGRIGLRAVNKQWTVALWARNLGNKAQPVIIFNESPGFMAIHGSNSVRAVGLNLEGHF